MNELENITSVGALEGAFNTLWEYTLLLTPKIISALIIILVGYIIASIFKSLVKNIINKLPVDDVMRSAGVTDLVEKSGYALNSGVVFGTLVKWFILILTFMTAFDVFGLNQATSFLKDVLHFLPNVMVATAILFIGMTLAGIVGKVVLGAAKTVKFVSPELLAKISKTIIIVFTVLAAMNQLQIASEFTQMLFAGIVFAISLALGLSFGLGGKDSVARYLETLQKNKN